MGMTEFLSVEGGRIAYDVAGRAPLVVLSHGRAGHPLPQAARW
jgi:hypothetical protein